MEGRTKKLNFGMYLLLAVGAALVLCMVVGTTMAYLTFVISRTDVFTVGNVSITLDEAGVGANDKRIANASRVAGDTNKLLPGRVYRKDLTVHFLAGSQASYLFVRVINGIAGIESTADGYRSIADQILNNGWTLFEDTIYVRSVPAARADAVDYPVFAGYAIDGDVGNVELAAYAGATITVKAYAVQREGFSNAAAAWNATFGTSDP